MKRNYLFIVAMLFLLGMTVVVATTHVLDERPKRPAFTPRQVERVLPVLPHWKG